MKYEQSQSYCFTLNNYTDDDMSAVIANEDKYEYICIGFEVGKKGTPHMQGYIRFDGRVSLKTAINRFSEIFNHKRCHIEPTKGTPKQAIEYCKKDGDVYEHGKQPTQGSAQWDKIEAAMTDPKSNPHLYNQYKKTYEAVQAMETEKRTKKSLRVIHFKDRIQYAQLHRDQNEKVSLDDDYTYYDNEPVLFLYANTTFGITEWFHGFPRKIKRGYQLIPANPEVIYLMWSDELTLEIIKTKYYGIIDEKWRKELE